MKLRAMKLRVIVFLACGAAACGGGCADSSQPTTTDLFLPGNGCNSIDFDTGTNCPVPSVVDFALNSTGNFTVAENPTAGGAIFTIGIVQGLDEITDVPTQGGAIAAGAIEGAGYVVTTVDAIPYRVFVEAPITNEAVTMALGFTIAWSPMTVE